MRTRRNDCRARGMRQKHAKASSARVAVVNPPKLPTIHGEQPHKSAGEASKSARFEERWAGEEDRAIMELVAPYQDDKVTRVPWVEIADAFPFRRHIDRVKLGNMIRNRLYRINKGIEKKMGGDFKKFCQKCQAPKIGHICPMTWAANDVVLQEAFSSGETEAGIVPPLKRDIMQIYAAAMAAEEAEQSRDEAGSVSSSDGADRDAGPRSLDGAFAPRPAAIDMIAIKRAKAFGALLFAAEEAMEETDQSLAETEGSMGETEAASEEAEVIERNVQVHTTTPPRTAFLEDAAPDSQPTPATIPELAGDRVSSVLTGFQRLEHTALRSGTSGQGGPASEAAESNGGTDWSSALVAPCAAAAASRACVAEEQPRSGVLIHTRPEPDTESATPFVLCAHSPTELERAGRRL